MERYSAFTLKAEIILDMLKTNVIISSRVKLNNIDYKPREWRGLWDTGASKSSIDKRIVDEMGLIPVGKGTICTANGIVPVNTYFIDLTLPNSVTVSNVLVTCADLGNDIDLLIGMDIIRHGDFAITNTENSTTFSFRMPSIEEIDYVEEGKEKNGLQEV